MSDFEAARKVAFDTLSLHQKITIANIQELDEKFRDFAEVWELECLCENSVGTGVTMTLFLCFSKTFPLTFPAIFISKESWDLIKYVPHIDSNCLICTFDTETTRTNPDDPAGVVYECLQKGRRIITEGLKGTNSNDFKEEFLSYWECNFDEKENVVSDILSLISDDPAENDVKLLMLKNKMGLFKYILYQETEGNARFIKFLEKNKYEYESEELFYAGDIAILDTPPFDLTNKSAIEKIKLLGEEKHKEFRKKVNKSNRRFFVLFRKELNNKLHYLGWFHPKADKMRDGFRPEILNPYFNFTTFQSTQKVHRASPVEYNSNRISKRTSGVDASAEVYKFLIVGLGSVGSNLVHFLNTLSYPEFKFVDYDILTIENIGRHLLGFNNVHRMKTLAMKDHLSCINPMQNITTSELSVAELFENEPSFINDNDFLFVVVGKTNIERWIARKIQNGEIVKPTFVLWVEPYLAGGHCIYIHPNDYKHDEYYEEIDGKEIFKFNIINSKEYISGNPNLTLKEAGCQSTYVPYSGSNVILFLSAIFPELLKKMTLTKEKSTSFSWVGDKKSISDISLELSDFARKNNSFTIIENSI